MTSEYQELRILNDIMEDAEVLRERIDGEGYLFSSACNNQKN